MEGNNVTVKAYSESDGKENIIEVFVNGEELKSDSSITAKNFK